ncbi:MAG: helix-hairpin-helix domain-containing protein [Lachnospiraceae bacterium]
MDKKQKRKLGLIAGFLIVCGTVSLGSHYAAQQKERIVLQRQAGSVSTSNSEMSENLTVQNEGKAKETGEASEAAGGGLQTQPEELWVYVCGAVAAAGVYSFPEGSRLVDAVTAAGGFTEEADTTYHNLAAYLADGQKLYVPSVAETKELSVAERIDDGGKTGEAQENEPVNINTADKELLMTLDGIGEAKAESILNYRKKVGPFQSIEELKNVTGIGEAMFERMKDKIVAE